MSTSEEGNINSQIKHESIHLTAQALWISLQMHISTLNGSSWNTLQALVDAEDEGEPPMHDEHPVATIIR